MIDDKITLGTLHQILIRVEQKVDRTNKRVSKLEAWKNRVIGGLIATNIVLIPIIYIIIKQVF